MVARFSVLREIREPRGRNFTEAIVRFAQDLQVTVVADRSRRGS